MKIDTKKPKVPIHSRVPKEIHEQLARLASSKGQKLAPYVERVLVEHAKRRAA